MSRLTAINLHDSHLINKMILVFLSLDPELRSTVKAFDAIGSLSSYILVVVRGSTTVTV